MQPWVSILFYYKVVVLYRVVSCLEEAHTHTYIHIIQDEKEKITHRLLRGKHPTPTKDDDDNDDCIDIAVHSWNQHPPPTLSTSTHSSFTLSNCWIASNCTHQVHPHYYSFGIIYLEGSLIAQTWPFIRLKQIDAFSLLVRLQSLTIN